MTDTRRLTGGAAASAVGRGGDICSLAAGRAGRPGVSWRPASCMPAMAAASAALAPARRGGSGELGGSATAAGAEGAAGEAAAPGLGLGLAAAWALASSCASRPVRSRSRSRGLSHQLGALPLLWRASLRHDDAHGRRIAAAAAIIELDQR